MLWGKIDISINPEYPGIEYKELSEKSKEPGGRKVKIAEGILRQHPSFEAIDLYFVAAKQAIQLFLAMKGVEYSSKISIPFPFANEHSGKGIAGHLTNFLGYM